MNKFFVLFTLLISGIANAQVADLKYKTAENTADRSAILDLARNGISKLHHQEVVFQVNHLKVSGGYAWLEADALRKDGKPLQFSHDFIDCCHVEGLFQKKNGKWTTVEFFAFTTDCWYCGIAYRFPKAPKAIFTDAALSK